MLLHIFFLCVALRWYETTIVGFHCLFKKNIPAHFFALSLIGFHGVVCGDRIKVKHRWATFFELQTVLSLTFHQFVNCVENKKISQFQNSYRICISFLAFFNYITLWRLMCAEYIYDFKFSTLFRLLLKVAPLPRPHTTQDEPNKTGRQF